MCARAGGWPVRALRARLPSRPDLFQDGGEAVAGAAEFEAHLLARPFVVTGKVAALGPPAFGVGVEGESGVRLGGDGEDFMGPLHRPAADEGAGLPARRRAGHEGLRKGARRGLARGGHGLGHGHGIPIAVQVRAVEVDGVAAGGELRDRRGVGIGGLPAGIEVSRADVERLMDVAHAMHGQPQRGLRRDVGRVVRPVAVPLDDRDAVRTKGRVP